MTSAGCRCYVRTDFFEIHQPKRRWIAAAPFEDRVVHHALCRLMQPVLERRFIARSYSCQIGKGTMAARECCRELTNRHKYVLKCDVSKFFHQIDHEILLEKLSCGIRTRRGLKNSLTCA
jgi:retron-type reverse transcriptase